MMEFNLESVVAPLVHWYHANARKLPWRDDPQPYHVWLSEIMLQQTRVEAALPYYHRFLKELPTISDLAQASEEKILKLWEGLGYYNRVRNMQKAAQVIMEEHHGQFPTAFEQIQKLPGIGSYTAGAIGSIALGICRPAVDGNVLRVITRVTADSANIDEASTKKRMEERLCQVIPPQIPGDFNQALMELGALVCLPNGEPKCESCPLCGLCRAHLAGEEEKYPVRRQKKARKVENRCVFVIRCAEKTALLKRPDKGLLAGLWELPNCLEGEKEAYLAQWQIGRFTNKLLGNAVHIFTHIEWKMKGYLIEAEQELPGFVWAKREELGQRYAVPSAFKAFLPK